MTGAKATSRRRNLIGTLPLWIAFTLSTGYLALIFLADSQRKVAILLGVGVCMLLAARMAGWLRLFSTAFDRHETLAACLAVVGTLAIVALFPRNSLVLFLIVTILVHMTACLGLNIQIGYAGMLNFAGGAMLGVGAYTVALLASVPWIPPILLLPLGGAMAALVGSLLLPPMLRTQGHYSAVVTIAFSVLFTTFLDAYQPIGGSQGLAVPALQVFGWSFNDDIVIGSWRLGFYANYLIVALIMTVACAVLVSRIERSWLGLNLDAVRTDETSAACFGLSITRTKIFAFTIGNFIVGSAGALYAFSLGYIAPINFTIADSLIMITVLLLGGLGSIWGIIVTTVLVQLLPERLQAIQKYRLLIYSLLVLLVLRFAPRGLVPRRVRQYDRGATS